MGSLEGGGGNHEVLFIFVPIEHRRNIAVDGFASG